VTVHLLNTPDSLDEIADDWRQLAAGHPFRGYDWLATWWRHYAPTGELLVLAVRDDSTNQLVGLAPWRIEQSARRGSVIRPLGDGEVCTDHSTPLAQLGCEQTVANELAQFLMEDFPDWDLLELSDTDANDPQLGLLTDALATRECVTRSRDADACWAIELPDDWETYLAMQSKSHRKQLRRAERRVLDSSDCHWHLVATPEEWQTAWPILVDLHQRRRQSLGEPGCFASAKFEAFHREASQALLTQGQLRMSWLELHGKPAAAEYSFASGDAWLAYQGGVDPDMLDDEPGRLSTIAMLRAAMAEGATTFDFLRGDEPYKAHWRAQPHLTLHRQFVPPRRSAQLRASADNLLGAVKTGLKSLRGAS